MVFPGSGNTAPVNHDGSSKFVWYSENTIGVEKLVTARYTITAFDLTNPEKMNTVTILLKKPDFYINPQQSPINPGDYVQLNGIAERGVTEVKIDIADYNGTILHTYTSSVSGSGYSNYGFRADLRPGHYLVSVSTSSIKNVFRTIITVGPSMETVPSATIPTPVSNPIREFIGIPNTYTQSNTNCSLLSFSDPLVPDHCYYRAYYFRGHFARMFKKDQKIITQ